MRITKDWTGKDYLKYVTDNQLDRLWSNWCNPGGGEFGIRVGAYKPIYTDGYAAWLDNNNKKCGKKSCDGFMIISDEDKENRIVNRLRCNSCGSKKDVLYRDVGRRVGGYRKPKLWLGDIDAVRYFAGLGRTFYSTLILYDKFVLEPDSQYVDATLMKSVSLGIDIDLKKGCITGKTERMELDEALNKIRKKLGLVGVGNSYNLQSSGRGVYFLLHHKLVVSNIFETCVKFNALIVDWNNDIENEWLKLDALNGPSRVFKLFGSIHQQDDVVALPLEYDVILSDMDSKNFLVENFDVNNYMNNGRLNFYKRFDDSEIKNLEKYLKENVVVLPTSSPRAMKASVRGEEDLSKWEKRCAEFMSKENWRIFEGLDIPGEVYYRTSGEFLEVNLFRVSEEDRGRIMKIVRDKIIGD
jgi:hypothetical protein